ncbi:DUF2723 domain-containing protein [bacterium]|nr:DUF2723 domain-containing protein [bacterium]
MNNFNDSPEKKGDFPWNWLNRIGAFFVFLITFGIYALTTQVSVSFWDCGEFIATSFTLGVPHPPGAPLFILLGRVITLLPLPLTPTFLINLYSSFFNALAITILFLIITFTLSRWFIKVANISQALIVLAGGISGALLTAFSDTFWNNAIEAEVYGVSMFLVTLVVYLVMLWTENRKEPWADKFLVFIPFLLYLGVGVHMTTMIMLPPLFLYIIVISPEKRRDLLFWFTWAVIFTVATSFKLFIFAMLFGLVFTLIGSLASFGAYARRWRLAFITILVCAIGFTTYGIIPIRSMQDPMIDENDPETLSAFEDYMDRKQYGQDSMWKAMFQRKGDWIHQLGFSLKKDGIYKTPQGKTIRADTMLERMGFWRQFSTQITGNRRDTLYGLIPLAFIILGIWWQYKEDKRWWFLLFMVMLVSTLGLLFYMNFSDGLHGTRLEVRVRDYFYTPGFMFMGMWTGIGLAALIMVINRFLKKSAAKHLVSVILSVAVILTPAIPLFANYYTHDRSRNYIPEDYAYNILQSCDKNAIIFTNGDNDTFPVWFVQAVQSVRTDVRVANLSLLNTNWYIKQLKNEMGINITFSDDQIDRLRPYRTENGVVRVQDIMVKHIINNADVVEGSDGELYIDPPIYFAVTVSPENKLNYDPYLSMEGLVYKLTTEKGKRQVGKDKMHENLFEVYRFRGLADSTIFKDDNSQKLLQNYTTAFMTLAMAQKQDGEPGEAVKTMEYANQILGYDWRSYVYLANLYAESGMMNQAEDLFNETMSKDRNNPEIYRVFADIFIRANQQERGLSILRDGYSMFPDDETLFKTLAYYYSKLDKQGEMQQLVNEWVARHPEDQELSKYLSRPKPKVIPDTVATPIPIDQDT